MTDVEQTQKIVTPDMGAIVLNNENEVIKNSLKLRRAVLTYRTHIDKELLKAMLTDKTPTGGKLTWFRAAHENGLNDPETPYEHTHVLFAWSKEKRISKFNTFDMVSGEDSIHPHINKITTNRHFYNASEYIAKEDPDNADLLAENKKQPQNRTEAYNKLAEMKDTTEVIKNYCFNKEGAPLPGSVNGILQMYEAIKNNEKNIDYREPKFGWQLDLDDEINNRPISPRKVIWYVDQYGNSGKSEFARYLYATKGKDWTCQKNMITTRDAATIICGELEAGWTGKGIVIDLPRQAEDKEGVYAYLEDIKDGHMTATKYQGQNKFFNSPICIVMSNWFPSTSKLSQDRWDIRRINKDKSVTRVTINDQPRPIQVTPIFSEKTVANMKLPELKRLLTLLNLPLAVLLEDTKVIYETIENQRKAITPIEDIEF